MSNFITTESHPEIKEGYKVRSSHKVVNSYERYPDSFWVYSEVFNYWLKRGYIKEVEEKEFTKTDMIDFANACINNNELIITEEHLNIWRP